MKNLQILKAYVDGSYNPADKVYGFGCVILQNEKIIENLKGRGHDPDYIGMRNVAGEICGSLCAMNYAARNGYKKIQIYYDYTGIENWATGKWKTNKEGTRRYKEMAQQFSKHIVIEFIKVPAHSGIRYNEIADQLAKEAAGILKNLTD